MCVAPSIRFHHNRDQNNLEEYICFLTVKQSTLLCFKNKSCFYYCGYTKISSDRKRLVPCNIMNELMLQVSVCFKVSLEWQTTHQIFFLTTELRGETVSDNFSSQSGNPVRFTQWLVQRQDFSVELYVLIYTLKFFTQLVPSMSNPWVKSYFDSQIIGPIYVDHVIVHRATEDNCTTGCKFEQTESCLRVNRLQK